MKSIAFFNNKGGVGKTSLVYHLAWMFSEMGIPVLAVDLDPQANLTSMFVDEDVLEGLWAADGPRRTVFGAMQPLLEGTGDIEEAQVRAITGELGLLVGDLALAASEAELNSQWPESMDRRPRAFRVLSAFWRMLDDAARRREAKWVLIDVGPNLGAINRAALLAAHKVVIPLAPDLYSLQGLKNLGPTLREWRRGWDERRARNPSPDLSMPPGTMEPLGYLVMQHAVRLDRPVQAYERWMARIPKVYREEILDEQAPAEPVTVAEDPHCLAALKHYRSLMPLAQEARKPMFLLRTADGAIGGHAKAAQDCYRDFQALATEIARRAELDGS